MNVHRLRTAARVGGLLVFAVLGLLLFSMHRTYSTLQREGGGSRPASKRRTVLAPGLGPDQALERLLGQDVTLHFSQDLTGDGDPELVASGGLRAGQGGAVLSRTLVLTRHQPGWTTLFDTADPRFWALGGEARREVNSRLGLRADEDPAPVLAFQGHYQLESVSPERILLEPVTPSGRGLGPLFAFEWNGRRGVFEPHLLSVRQPTP